VTIGAEIAATTAPDSVLLAVRPLGGSWFQRFVMQPAGAYDYRATIPADSLPAGAYEYAVTVVRGDSSLTFPGPLPLSPWDWDFGGQEFFRFRIVPPATPLRLFTPAEDASRLLFSRIGDAVRRGLFRVVPSADRGELAVHMALPVFRGRAPEDYTASLLVKDLVESRGPAIAAATGLRLRLRGLGTRQVLHVTLMEADGTSWSAAVPVDSTWSTVTVPLSDLHAARGVLLPEGFPGNWNYWVGPAQGRGGSGDSIRVPEVERLQFSLRSADAGTPVPAEYGVEIESATLVFR
jgi:hypothetical protein